METNDNRSPPPTASEHRLDATAIEALSAGIGLGSLVTKKKNTTHPPRSHKKEEANTSRNKPAPTVPRVRRSFLHSTLAWCCDLLIIAGSLLAATSAAHYATTNTLPLPADILFALNERFAAHEIAIALTAMLGGYFILFKLLTGLTLGETLLGARRK